MALFERRTSVENFDRWRGQSPTGSERRKLSFNPIAEWHPPVIQEENPGEVVALGEAAFEVSAAKRIAQVVFAVIYCLLAAGPVFGFAALKPVLVQRGVYRDLCTSEELKEDVWVCYGQEVRLNLMFTLAAVSTNLCALPVGTVLDRYGPKAASLIGVFFLTLGTLSMAIAEDVAFDAYIPGYLFLALGGPFVFISAFQLSNTFPRYSGSILALLTGAFDTSSAIFLIYRLLYQHSNETFTPKKFFLIYLVVPVFILVAQIFVMPTQSYKTVGELVTAVEEEPTATTETGEDVATEVTNLLGSKNGDEQAKKQQQTASTSGVYGALHGKTAAQQIASPWFVLITLFTVIQMLRINYFVATVRTQYTMLLHSRKDAIKINDFFDVALPLGGVIAIPFIGLVLDHTSTPFVLFLLVTIATAIGVLGIIPEFWAAYGNIALFVVYRPLYYTAVSDYSAKVFGFATFGKVYGLVICLAGIFNFAQAGLDAVTHSVFDEDPVPVNVILLSIALAIGVVLVGYVWRKSYSVGRERLEEQAEAAEETAIPSAANGSGSYGTASTPRQTFISLDLYPLNLLELHLQDIFRHRPIKTRFAALLFRTMATTEAEGMIFMTPEQQEAQNNWLVAGITHALLLQRGIQPWDKLESIMSKTNATPGSACEKYVLVHEHHCDICCKRPRESKSTK